MDDLEMTKLCAEAMGWKHLGPVGNAAPKPGEPDPVGRWCLSGGNDWWVNPTGDDVCAPCLGLPDPLHDDAAAMALVKRFRLDISQRDSDTDKHNDLWDVTPPDENNGTVNADLNRAVCLCVAKLQAGRGK